MTEGGREPVNEYVSKGRTGPSDREASLLIKMVNLTFDISWYNN